MSRTVLLSVAAALGLAAGAVQAQTEVARGEQAFRKCQACHSLEAGPKRVGPPLAGVAGRQAAALPGFNYSTALARAEIIWTDDMLDRFIANPAALVHGTKMTYPGIKDAGERAAIIAYLKVRGAEVFAQQQQGATKGQPKSAAKAESKAEPKAKAAGKAAPKSEGSSGPAMQHAAAPAGRASGVSGDASLPAGYTADVRYTLRTDVAEGRMVYVGVGGDIDRKVNPTLEATAGQVVQITLLNGAGAMHDIAVPEANIRSNYVTGRGASTALGFRLKEPGEFAYYSSLPGHREAGMNGRIVVQPGTDVATPSDAPDIVHDPARVPKPIGKRPPQTVRVDLESTEVEGRLADGTTYQYWTFNNTVPGPFLRVRVGDTVDVNFKNSPDAAMIHSVDFHAATGPGGGATHLQVAPGGTGRVTFKALVPGLYVYHCATPMVAHHIANGMYGLILVEPEEGLPPVDREFYVMQGEIYTEGRFGEQGSQEFSVEKLLDERAEYVVFNGAVGALTTAHPMQAKVGETVRLFFGVGGPNYTSSFHVIGEIFDRAYNQGDVISPPAKGVQTIMVPAGGSAIVDFKLDVPGRYILVDHSLSRMERGLVGFLNVEGPEDVLVYKAYTEPAAASGH